MVIVLVYLLVYNQIQCLPHHHLILHNYLILIVFSFDVNSIVNHLHKLIILKGKSAQEEVNKALMKEEFEYKLEDSITNKESKIIIIDVKK